MNLLSLNSGNLKKSSSLGARIEQTYVTNVSSIVQNVASSDGEILNEVADGKQNRETNTPEVIGQKVTQDVNDGFTDGLAAGYFGGKQNHDTQN